jgi:hypothetical protein
METEQNRPIENLKARGFSILFIDFEIPRGLKLVAENRNFCLYQKLHKIY